MITLGNQTIEIYKLNLFVEKGGRKKENLHQALPLTGKSGPQGQLSLFVFVHCLVPCQLLL